MMNQALFTSETDKHNTPTAVIDDLATVFRWNVDVCASSPNVCKSFYNETDNGLLHDWYGLCWMNPPYGNGMNDWMIKARAEIANGNATGIVCLVPARTDTRWWQDNVCYASHVTFIKGRLRFNDAANSAPFPSAFVVFGRINQAQATKLRTYGWTPYGWHEYEAPAKSD